ncbi:MAG: hypothetical protein EA424_26305 [Planctomycetaceae bacterium]|nr:MAG: hypothetical protein EA424_26305 [Planctomycetaceae bacterium]
MGVELGAEWDDRKAILQVSGSLGRQPAMPLFVLAEIEGLPPAKLAFAWLNQNGVPLILGQTNFFMEFDACFYRSRLEFDIRPRSPTP